MFALSPDVQQKLDAWRSAQDAMVFQEQVVTGGFRAKQKLDTNVWQIVKAMDKAGMVSPYYGVSGGGYWHQFYVSLKTTTIRCSNSYTEQFIELQEQSEIQVQTRGIRRLRALMPGASASVAPEGWMTFTVRGREYTKLVAWPHWDRSSCFTPRYHYRFGITTLGITVQVVDVTSNQEIDVTDYDDW